MKASVVVGLRRALGKFLGAFGLLVALGAAPAAHASDWGCEVLLCLSNPAGPTAVAECVPPITQLWNALAHFQPFPTCGLASATGSYASLGTNYYNVCPAGTTALAAGAVAVQAPSAAALTNMGVYDSAAVQIGIGTGDGLLPQVGGDGFPLAMPDKTCVGGSPLGQVMVLTSSGTWTTATVYSQIVSLPPQASGSVIDVYVDSALYTQVRY